MASPVFGGAALDARQVFVSAGSGVQASCPVQPLRPSSVLAAHARIPWGLMAHLRADPDLSAMWLDSTVGRAWQAHPKREKDPALGHSRGSFNTQIRRLTDGRGYSPGLRVTGGPRPDRTQARRGRGPA